MWRCRFRGHSGPGRRRRSGWAGCCGRRPTAAGAIFYSVVVPRQPRRRIRRAPPAVPRRAGLRLRRSRTPTLTRWAHGGSRQLLATTAFDDLASQDSTGYLSSRVAGPCRGCWNHDVIAGLTLPVRLRIGDANSAQCRTCSVDSVGGLRGRPVECRPSARSAFGAANARGPRRRCGAPPACCRGACCLQMLAARARWVKPCSMPGVPFQTIGHAIECLSYGSSQQWAVEI